MRPPRIVFDTASFITAMRSSSGAARQVLKRVVDGKVVLVMDYKLVLEYRAVALRPEHLEHSRLSHSEMSAVIDSLASYAEPAEGIARLRPVSPDPNDDMIVELAVSAAVDAIVTGNVRRFASIMLAFGIAVLTPAQLLQQLGTGGS